LQWIPPSNSVIPNFEIAAYRINVNDGYTVDINVSGNVTNYTFDSSSFSCGTTLTFSVEAIYTAGYQEMSNDESVNIFQYASAPNLVNVAWATPGETGPNTIDLAMTWQNPSSNGCGTPTQFIIQVLDSSGSVVSTTIQPYDESTITYSLYLDNITSSQTGSVSVALETLDTNGQGLLAGAAGTAVYITSELPIFKNILQTGTQLSFDVVSNTLLDKIGRFIYFTTRQETQELSTVPGVAYDYEVTLSTLSNGDFIYNFVFQQYYFTGATIPANLCITVSNNYGIGFGLVNP
jgi:hypothetical protein